MILILEALDIAIFIFFHYKFTKIQACPHDGSITVKLFTKIVGYDYGQFFTDFISNGYRQF